MRSLTTSISLFLALFMALILSIVPLPAAIVEFRPPWILMLILYTQFFLPNYFNIILILFLGLCLDVLSVTVIGEHALALLLTTWLAASKARLFNFFSIAQQMIMVALLCFVYQFTLFIIDIFLGYKGKLLIVAATAIISLFLWPWILWVLSHDKHIGLYKINSIYK